MVTPIRKIQWNEFLECHRFTFQEDKATADDFDFHNAYQSIGRNHFLTVKIRKCCRLGPCHGMLTHWETNTLEKGILFEYRCRRRLWGFGSAFTLCPTKIEIGWFRPEFPQGKKTMLLLIVFHPTQLQTSTVALVVGRQPPPENKYLG